MRSRALVALLAVVCLAQTAPGSDRHFRVSGGDTIQLDGQARTVTYDGRDRVTVSEAGTIRRFASQSSYRRDEAGAATEHTANFVTEVTADGDQRDVATSDPDEMSVLHQPFMVALDRATRQGLEAMRTQVPFSFAAPVGETNVQGNLERVDSPTGTIAVDFDASGPFSGEAPDHSGRRVDGNLRMHGSALYTADEGSLLDLKVTVEITGDVGAAKNRTPIFIVHRRAFALDDQTHAALTAPATAAQR